MEGGGRRRERCSDALMRHQKDMLLSVFGAHMRRFIFEFVYVFTFVSVYLPAEFIYVLGCESG